MPTKDGTADSPVDGSDAEAIAASATDPDAFAVLFDRHSPHIHRYLARRLGRQVADDLLAETFLTAFRKRAGYDLSRPDARPWLYGIATNLVSGHRRAEQREYRLRSMTAVQSDVDCHADRVAAQVTAQAMTRLLATAMAELSDGDRDVLVLIAWEGLAYDEVASSLDIPVGTVRSRLNRARRKVRLVLDTPETNPTTRQETTQHG
ncbi:RNA polymerase sigma-70 factor, ECF subfamily [Amycolatopsis marina]|uniref:RNA polymerase sigma-70 factor, ECF subfamily n=1 Tax=Amycolatopsis marina TaxID=490629 RepID=A0A1I1CNP6_9PSEU|nr:RNA polymerase sigma factor [Amycolatopsis marina]SFB62230.1 RNA polymerase sigma-70 factor, ECF subfamily [Amycolatopsis marina]